MNDLQTAYRAMLRDQVAPAFRELGLKGSGTLYRLDTHDHFAHLGFQSSRFNGEGELRFTINLCAVPTMLWESARREFEYLPPIPSPNTTYFGGRRHLVWQQRIGRCLPEPNDLWWFLHRPSDAVPTSEQVIATVREYGLPEMRRHLQGLSKI